MDAYVRVCTSSGQELLSAHIDDHDPFIILAFRGATVPLTRDEARQAADALHAASLRPAPDDFLEFGGHQDDPSGTATP